MEFSKRNASSNTRKEIAELKALLERLEKNSEKSSDMESLWNKIIWMGVGVAVSVASVIFVSVVNILMGWR